MIIPRLSRRKHLNILHNFFIQQPQSFAQRAHEIRLRGIERAVAQRVGEGEEEVVNALNKLIESTLIGAAAGAGAERVCKGCTKGWVVVLSTALGFLAGLGDLVFRSQPGDIILTYYYEDSNGQIWQQTVVIRNEQIISYEVTPYTTPWYVPFLPSEN